MRQKLRTILLALVAVVALAFVALIAFTVGKPTPMLPLPSPNGYDDLVKAGKVLTNDLPGFQELRDMREDELRTAFATTSLAKHGEAIAFAKVGLGRTCRVPLDYSATSAAPLDRLSAIKRVARAFIAQGRLAEMENRGVDAANSYLDLIRLGQESARGGVVLDEMNGRAVEAVGLVFLEKLTPKLDAKQCREVASALENIDAKRESIEVVLQQERTWACRTYGLIEQIDRLISFKSLRQSEQKHAARIKRHQTGMRLLTIELALRCFQSEQGRVPLRLEELTPKYFQCVPMDPFSDQPLVYHAQGTNWLLYSIGPDGVDDGGKPVGRSVSDSVSKGDLFFDSPQ